MANRLNGKTALITGAGSGIGRASALRFAREGAVVYVNDTNQHAAEMVVAEIHEQEGAAEIALADVTDPAAVRALIDRVVAERGRLDVLFNNVGGQMPTPTHEVSIDEYHRLMTLNLGSAFYGVHAALPTMMRQRAGVILATSSGAGIGAVEGLAVYGAAKAGMASLMGSIAAEYGRYGIRANTISPGPMDTPALRQYLDTVPNGAAIFARQVPVGRLGTGDDIAAAAVFLASDEAAFVNGVVLPVDGAIHARLAAPRLQAL